VESSGYEPPQYSGGNEGETADWDASPEKPKRTFPGDGDDDDFVGRAAKLKQQEKDQKEREEKEAFKKAADEANGNFNSMRSLSIMC
jgi:hypothetical protein